MNTPAAVEDFHIRERSPATGWHTTFDIVCQEPGRLPRHDGNLTKY